MGVLHVVSQIAHLIQNLFNMNTYQNVLKIFGEKEYPQRTQLQNKSLHLWYVLLAKELNAAGLDMRTVLKPEIDIPWTAETVKEHLWRKVQIAHSGKSSTAELTTNEITAIYEILNKHIGEKFGVHVPFPNIDYLLLSE